MKGYRIHRRQFLPIGPDQAREFFWTPYHLEAMTPPFLNFRITSEVPEHTYNGLIITYRMATVAGIPLTGVTELRHVVEPFRFVDQQRFGPFRFRNHQHRPCAVTGGHRRRTSFIT